ncbi:MAG: phytanoyl-CoA dioxygenase family protein [Candidatus Handelsmanbacteria bacterium]|nr:phytanoyl-CoA dioxygenase family protein [Candidatus Handelsmanbacteria bacterium]
MNSLWLLDPFTPENGVTRIRPGTHRSGKVSRDEMADPLAPHPHEVVLQAPAGPVIAFNSHLWHGGTLNRTHDLRRVLLMAFVPRHRKQLTDHRRYLHPETSRRFTPQMKHLLDL